MISSSEKILEAKLSNMAFLPFGKFYVMGNFTGSGSYQESVKVWGFVTLLFFFLFNYFLVVGFFDLFVCCFLMAHYD